MCTKWPLALVTPRRDVEQQSAGWGVVDAGQKKLGAIRRWRASDKARNGKTNELEVEFTTEYVPELRRAL